MKNFKIGIAGVGGIGSNVAVHLVRTGIFSLKIVDFDKVELSNLNRQFYFSDQTGLAKIDALYENLKRINSAAEKIERENKFLDENNIVSTFNDCDIIVEGFDKAEYKAMLINSLAAHNKYIVSASGVAGIDTEEITVKKIADKIYIAGDFKTDFQYAKLYSPKIFITASIMSNIILKLVYEL